MTTTSPSNEMDPSTSEDRFFAHLADSVGWSTQFILFTVELPKMVSLGDQSYNRIWCLRDWMR